MFSKILSYQEVKDILISVRPLRDQALLCLTYGTLARVGEIVRGKYAENPPVNKEDIETIYKGEQSYLVIRLLTEKTHIPRRVPINRNKEYWLTEPILKYADLVNFELFPYSTRWAQKIFLKHFGSQHIHLLRKWRATHLLQGAVSGAPLEAQTVARMGGWQNLASLGRSYDGSVIEDYVELI